MIILTPQQREHACWISRKAKWKLNDYKHEQKMKRLAAGDQNQLRRDDAILNLKDIGWGLVTIANLAFILGAALYSL